jgi:hypothetical protein
VKLEARLISFFAGDSLDLQDGKNADNGASSEPSVCLEDANALPNMDDSVDASRAFKKVSPSPAFLCYLADTV